MILHHNRPHGHHYHRHCFSSGNTGWEGSGRGFDIHALSDDRGDGDSKECM